MIVLCPQCQSRYQLADEKIREKGTKVRCPRCQNTFRVYPEGLRNAPAQNPSQERDAFFDQGQTELAPPSTPSMASPAMEVSKTATTQGRTASKTVPQFAEETSNPFSGPTRVSEEMPSKVTASTMRTKEQSPFKKQPSVTINFDEPMADEDTAQEPFEATASTQSPFSSKSKKESRNDVRFAEEQNEDLVSEATELARTSAILEQRSRSQVKKREKEANDFRIDDDDDFVRESKEITDPVHEEQEQPRPFGSETFLEIRNYSKPKSALRKRILIGGSIALAAIAGYFLATQYPMGDQTKSEIASSRPRLDPVNENAPTDSMESTPSDESTKEVEREKVPQIGHVEVRRPKGWYKQEPGIIQDYLSQMAMLPPPEQQKPHNRSLIAEALILNGFFTGASDQLSTGLGYSSGLMVGDPTSIYGYYGLANYALWKDDVVTLADLVKRWPEIQRLDPEYRLSEAVVRARVEKNLRSGLELLKALLNDSPEYQTALSWTYYLSLESKGEDALEVFGEAYLQGIQKSYQRHRDLLKSSYQASPPLYANIERRARLLGKSLSTASGRESSKSAKSPSKQKSLPQAPAPEVPPAPTPSPSVAPPAPAPAPTPTPIQAPTGRQSKKLPKVSDKLVALNRETSSAKVGAKKLLEEGIVRQKENKLEEAIALFQKALQLDSDLAEVYKRLGMIYMGRKENERALLNFKLYLQLKPDSDDKKMVQSWINSLQ